MFEENETVYPDKNNVVLNENSVEGKKTMYNRESKSNEIII